MHVMISFTFLSTYYVMLQGGCSYAFKLMLFKLIHCESILYGLRWQVDICLEQQAYNTIRKCLYS